MYDVYTGEPAYGIDYYDNEVLAWLAEQDRERLEAEFPDMVDYLIAFDDDGKFEDIKHPTPFPTTILINARTTTVETDILSYEDIVEMVYGDRTLNPTVIYSRSRHEKPTGVLIPGRSVKIKDGTEIDAVFTGNA